MKYLTNITKFCSIYVSNQSHGAYHAYIFIEISTNKDLIIGTSLDLSVYNLDDEMVYKDIHKDAEDLGFVSDYINKSTWFATIDCNNATCFMEYIKKIRRFFRLVYSTNTDDYIDRNVLNYIK